MTDERLNELETDLNEYHFIHEDDASELIGALRAANLRIAELEAAVAELESAVDDALARRMVGPRE